MHAPYCIEPLSPSSRNEAGDVLGAAFSENPVARAALDHCDPASRLKKVSGLNRALVGMALQYGLVDVARMEERIVGVSIHFPSGSWPIGPGGLLWELRAGLAVGPRGAYRYLRYEMAVGPQHYQAPHAYLFALGVLPEMQGRGIGSALLRSFCARADTNGVPCYLETDKETSVRLYQANGFDVTGEVDIQELSGLHTWLMLRKSKEEH